jgi:hypothetical protein
MSCRCPDRALEIIASDAKRSGHLFANDESEPLSNMAMLELLQGMGFGED